MTPFPWPIDTQGRFRSSEHVRVHDLLVERGERGFDQKVSSYLKLRLVPTTVDRLLTDAGFDIEVGEETRGMHTRVARRRE